MLGKLNKLGFLKKFSAKSQNLLQNVYVLYFVSIIAILDLFYLMISSDFLSTAIFILIGILTSFFSKNMIVILCIAAAFTNIIKYGISLGVSEGFAENAENAENAEDAEDEKNEEDKKKKNENMNDKKGIDEETEAEPKPEKKDETSNTETTGEKKESMVNPLPYSHDDDENSLLNKQVKKLLQQADRITATHTQILEKMDNIGGSVFGSVLGYKKNK
jgi:hypothetical protein